MWIKLLPIRTGGEIGKNFSLGENFWLYGILCTDGHHATCAAGVGGSYRILTIQFSLRVKHFLNTLDRTSVPLFD